MSACSPSRVSQWPFWLLIAAWACANVPNPAIGQFLGWVRGAEHFSHNAELRQSVAGLLAGPTRDHAEKLAKADAAPEHRSPAPAVPADQGFKKSDFDPSTETLRLIALLPPEARPIRAIRPLTEPVTEVPCPPPRAARLV